MSDLTPEAERAELEALLLTVGWQLYQRQMAIAWGPEAFERQVDQALDNASPDEELAITKRIRDTFKGVRASLKWPEERIRQLKEGEKRINPADPFARFRRVPGARA